MTDVPRIQRFYTAQVVARAHDKDGCIFVRYSDNKEVCLNVGEQMPNLGENLIFAQELSGDAVSGTFLYDPNDQRLLRKQGLSDQFEEYLSGTRYIGRGELRYNIKANRARTAVEFREEATNPDPDKIEIAMRIARRFAEIPVSTSARIPLSQRFSKQPGVFVFDNPFSPISTFDIYDGKTGQLIFDSYTKLGKQAKELREQLSLFPCLARLIN